ncbi:hypothetical protein ACFLU8_02905 [Chloroflexota bacterium]
MARASMTTPPNKEVFHTITTEILELPQPIINHKESKSKKAKVFALFSQGKRPGDPDLPAGFADVSPLIQQDFNCCAACG